MKFLTSTSLEYGFDGLLQSPECMTKSTPLGMFKKPCIACVSLMCQIFMLFYLFAVRTIVMIYASIKVLTTLLTVLPHFVIKVQ
jgi:hypothetical protein